MPDPAPTVAMQPVAVTGQPERPPFFSALWRALGRRCPACGKGALFSSYLKQVDRCAVCDEAYGHLRADDAPPWLTILVVGHIVIPTAATVETFVDWPTWLSVSVWVSIALTLTLLVLPRAKAVFLAAIWALRAPGSEAG